MKDKSEVLGPDPTPDSTPDLWRDNGRVEAAVASLSPSPVVTHYPVLSCPTVTRLWSRPRSRPPPSPFLSYTDLRQLDRTVVWVLRRVLGSPGPVVWHGRCERRIDTSRRHGRGVTLRTPSPTTGPTSGEGEGNWFQETGEEGVRKEEWDVRGGEGNGGKVLEDSFDPDSPVEGPGGPPRSDRRPGTPEGNWNSPVHPHLPRHSWGRREWERDEVCRRTQVSVRPSSKPLTSERHQDLGQGAGLGCPQWWRLRGGGQRK